MDILTWASDASEYRQKAETIAATLDLFVIGVEKEEPLSLRLANLTPSEELEDMISRAEGNPNAIIWGTFYRWDFDTRVRVPPLWGSVRFGTLTHGSRRGLIFRFAPTALEQECYGCGPDGAIYNRENPKIVESQKSIQPEQWE